MTLHRSHRPRPWSELVATRRRSRFFGRCFTRLDLTGTRSILPASVTGPTDSETDRARYAGLYWDVAVDEDGRRSRVFLRNYFRTFAHTLRRDGTYAVLLGNRATVLTQLGRDRDAETHLSEAREFSL